MSMSIEDELASGPDPVRPEPLPPGVTRFILFGRWVGTYDAWSGEHDAWLEDLELVPLGGPL